MTIRKGRPFTGEQARILVVEDNIDNMLTVKALLEPKYKVFSAQDGLEGVRLAEDEVPDLVLMDIALPEIDGIEAFRRIRKNRDLEHIPIIALTASALTQDRNSILAHGFDAFISKPIMETEFFSVLERVLHGE